MRSRGHGPTRCQSERCSNHAASCAVRAHRRLSVQSDDGERDIREPRTTRTAPTTAPSVCRHTAIVVMNSGTLDGSRILKLSTFSYAISATAASRVGIGRRLVRRSGTQKHGAGAVGDGRQAGEWCEGLWRAGAWIRLKHAPPALRTAPHFLSLLFFTLLLYCGR